MRLRTRTLGIVGAAAFVSLGALSVGLAHDDPRGVDLAGSGDAPANTTYVQPTAGGMNMGATATWTAPPSIEATAKAVPSGSAG
ncbi:hypothetical protein MMAD_06630 [Mycolicibacterium madagascariense]|uniref:Uncharacterized protein n=2 Tax=Mycolicibacterium madagascariense TaxID=212765 RepID=A0A7I7XD91_9MYCO|nr:hypothetical protein MMAD_06630 [Mycolicibacterium madagascariense]